MKSSISIAATLVVALPTATDGRPGTRRVVDDFCLQLQRVIDAAKDERPFHILGYGRAAPPTFGFAPGSCGIAESGGKTAWRCHQSLAPEGLSLQSLVAKIGWCGTGADRLPSPRGTALYALPGLTIRISESGGPRAHVGRVVRFAVEGTAGIEESEAARRPARQ